jgi:hypothetical protein
LDKILAPIVLFVYNRPNHTMQTIEALQKNELASESELFIYSDEAKDDDARESVDKVRKYIGNIDGFKKVTVIKREINWGLANSIIDGVTNTINKYKKIIVLEDDLVTNKYFLKFMNEGLDLYEKDNQVASIHGYIYPIDSLPDNFFIKGADCWGWATWENKWDIFEPDGKKLLKELTVKNLAKEADFNDSYGFTKMLKDQINGNNNSWAIRWYMSAFLKNMVTLYPGQSYVQNIGFDSQGTHCGKSDIFNINLNTDFIFQKIKTNENPEIRKKIEFYFKSIKPSIFTILKSKIYFTYETFNKIINPTNFIKHFKKNNN